MDEFDLTKVATADLLTDLRVHGKFLKTLSSCIDYSDHDTEYNNVVLGFRNTVVDYYEDIKKELTNRKVEFEDVLQPKKSAKADKETTELDKFEIDSAK